MRGLLGRSIKTSASPPRQASISSLSGVYRCGSGIGGSNGGSGCGPAAQQRRHRPSTPCASGNNGAARSIIGTAPARQAVSVGVPSAWAQEDRRPRCMLVACPYQRRRCDRHRRKRSPALIRQRCGRLRRAAVVAGAAAHRPRRAAPMSHPCRGAMIERGGEDVGASSSAGGAGEHQLS